MVSADGIDRSIDRPITTLMLFIAGRQEAQGTQSQEGESYWFLPHLIWDFDHSTFRPRRHRPKRDLPRRPRRRKRAPRRPLPPRHSESIDSSNQQEIQIKYFRIASDADISESRTSLISARYPHCRIITYSSEIFLVSAIFSNCFSFYHISSF